MDLRDGLKINGRKHMRQAIILLTIGLLASPISAFADDMAGMNMGASPADKAFMESMQTMMKDMNAKPTGDADKDFVTMMLPHHQGAVDMAKVELQYGKDPMLRDLATSIIAAQEKEIGMMKGWQANHPK
jgi:uncharacterized protein (DUF305 family)